MSYVPTYSKVKEEIVSVTLNVSNYVTQKEIKNVTKVEAGVYRVFWRKRGWAFLNF